MIKRKCRRTKWMVTLFKPEKAKTRTVMEYVGYNAYTRKECQIKEMAEPSQITRRCVELPSGIKPSYRFLTGNIGIYEMLQKGWEIVAWSNND